MEEAGHTAVVSSPCCGNDDSDLAAVPRRAAGGRTAPPVYWMINVLNQTKGAESILGRFDG